MFAQKRIHSIALCACILPLEVLITYNKEQRITRANNKHITYENKHITYENVVVSLRKRQVGSKRSLNSHANGSSITE